MDVDRMLTTVGCCGSAQQQLVAVGMSTPAGCRQNVNISWLWRECQHQLAVERMSTSAGCGENVNISWLDSQKRFLRLSVNKKRLRARACTLGHLHEADSVTEKVITSKQKKLIDLKANFANISHQ